MSVIVLKCLRCGNEWAQRNPNKVPRNCPRCVSPYWNKERRIRKVKTEDSKNG
jgi:predicted Zn-ribbon and HTH transcriptional regulator